MQIQIEHVQPGDLAAVVKIERLGFSAAEAGTPAAFPERINRLRETFLVARMAGRVVGFIVGPAVAEPFVTDDMYTHTPTNLPRGGHQLVLSIATDPAYRGHGIGGQLLAALEQEARAAHRLTMSLDSLAKNVPFYEHHGFHKARVSDSTHANETWYSLVKDL